MHLGQVRHVGTVLGYFLCTIFTFEYKRKLKCLLLREKAKIFQTSILTRATDKRSLGAEITARMTGEARAIP